MMLARYWLLFPLCIAISLLSLAHAQIVCDAGTRPVAITDSFTATEAPLDTGYTKLICDGGYLVCGFGIYRLKSLLMGNTKIIRDMYLQCCSSAGVSVYTTPVFNSNVTYPSSTYSETVFAVPFDITSFSFSTQGLTVADSASVNDPLLFGTMSLAIVQSCPAPYAVSGLYARTANGGGDLTYFQSVFAYCSTRCSQCPPASYCLGNATAISCPPNTDSPAGSTALRQCTCLSGFTSRAGVCYCPVNTFLVGSGVGACTPCLPNSVCTGDNTLVPCPPYSTVVSNGSAWSGLCLCDVGYYSAPNTYSDRLGDSNCLMCPENSGTLTQGGRTHLDCVCAPGFISSSPGAACSPCFPGGYCPGYGGGTVVCVPGTYQTGYGVLNASGCTACATGTYSTAVGSTTPANCISCAAGTFHTGIGATLASVCQSCVPGTYNPFTGMSACTLCKAGTVQPTSGATSQAKCSPCMAGTYQTALGMGPLSSCILCPAGTYQPVLGMGNLSGCILCRAGLYQSNIGQPFASSCLPCQAGTFQTNLGAQTSAQCVACAAGEYQSASGSEHPCTPCAKGTYSFGVGQQSSSTCIKCCEGSYQPLLGRTSVEACVKCSTGTYQTGSGMQDANDCMVCGPGTFQPLTGATSAAACTPCPSGTFQSGLGGGGILDCVACSPGTFQTGTGADSVLSCISCQPGTYQPSFGANSSAQCIPCAAGKYFAGVGVAGTRDCTPCSVGTYQTTVGSTAGSGCLLCGPGTYQSELGAGSLQACTLCSPGTYQTGVAMGTSTACLPCGQGTFSSGYGVTALREQACTPCSPGTYQPRTTPGASACQNCEAGTFQTGSGASFCSICSPGTYQPNPGAKYDWYCTPCEQGSYSTAYGAPAASNCTSCKEGTFADTEGLTSCLLCAEGKYTPNPREPICFSCMSGTYSNRTGTSACTPCPAGQFATGVGNTRCIECEPRQFQFQQGSTACLLCPPGLFQFRYGSTQCEQCLPGQFQSGYNQSECAECDPGTYSLTMGATTCAACTTGGYQPSPNATGCMLCEAGSFQNQTGASVCVPCAVGFFQEHTGGSTCIQCKAGSFQSEPAATACLKCGEGTYQTALALARQEDCFNCTPGFFGASQGLTLCTACATGHYAWSEGSSTCSPCAPGSFQDQPNATACNLCSAGTFSTAWGSVSDRLCHPCSPGMFSLLQGSTACDLCPAGTHSSASATITCTPCAAGTFMENLGCDADLCTPCVAGTFSYELGANSSTTCTLCNDGYFSPNPAQATISTCLECPAGTVSVPNKTTCEACAAGTFCPPGYHIPIRCVEGLVCNGTHMRASPTFLAFLSSNCTAAIPCPRGTHCALGDVTRGPGLLLPFPNQTHFVVYASGANTTNSSCPGAFVHYGYARVNWPFTHPPVTDALYWLQPVGCPAGMYLLDDVCTNCPIGMFSGSGNALDWNVCQPCPTGTFGAVLGATSCTACRVGEYSDRMQSISCRQCASGTYQDLSGGSACLPCLGGTFVDHEGADACIPCAAGDFQPSTGATVCAACSPLQYSSSGDNLCSDCGSAPLSIDPGHTCPPLALPIGSRTTSSIWLSMQGQDSDECLSTGPIVSTLGMANELAVSYIILRPYAVCTTTLYVSDRPTLTKSWMNSVGHMGRPVLLYVIPYNTTFYPILCKRQGFGVLFAVADESGAMETNMTGAKAVLSILDVTGTNVLFRMGCARLPLNANANVPLGVCRTSFCPTMKVIVRVTLTWQGMSSPPIQGDTVLSPGPVGFCPPTLSWLVVVELQQGSVPYLPGDTLSLQVKTINPPAQGALVVFRFILRILAGVTMLSFQSSYSVVTEYADGLLSVVGDSSQGGGAVLGMLRLRLDASASGVMLVAQAVKSSFQLTMANAVPYTMLVRTMGFSCRSDGYIDMLADFPRPTALITNSKKRYVINWRTIQSTALDSSVSIHVVSVSNVMHVFGSVTATCTSLAPSSLQVTSCGIIRAGALSNQTAAVRVQYQSMVKIVQISAFTPVNTTFTAIPSSSGLSGRYKVTTTLTSGDNVLANVDATPYIPRLLAMGVSLGNQQWKCPRSGMSFAIGAPVLYSGFCGYVPKNVQALPQAAASIFLVTGGWPAAGRYTFSEPQLSTTTPLAALLLFSPSGTSLGIARITSLSPLNQVLATPPNSSAPLLSLHNTGSSGRCVAIAVESAGVTYVRSLPVIPAAPVSLQLVLSTYILVSQRDTSMFVPASTFVVRAALFFSDGTQLAVQADPRLSMASDLLDVAGLGATSRYDAVNASIVFHLQGIPCVSTTVWVRVVESSVVSSQLLCPTCPQVLASQDDPLSQQFPLVYPSSVPLSAVVVRRLLVDGRTVDRVEPIAIGGDALALVGLRLVGQRQGVASISSPSVAAPLLLTVLDRWATSFTLLCNQMICSSALKFAPPGDAAGTPPFSYATSLVLSLSVGLADGRDVWFPWLAGVVPLINQTRIPTLQPTMQVSLSFGDLGVHCEFGVAWRITESGDVGPHLLRVTRLAFLSLQGPSMLYQLHCSGTWEEARFNTTATLTDGVVDTVAPEYSSLAPLVLHHSSGLFHAENAGQGSVTARFGGHEIVSLVLVTVSSRYFTAVNVDFLPYQWSAWRGQSLTLTPALTPVFVANPWYDPMLVNSRVVQWTSSAPDTIRVSLDATTLTLLADYYEPVTLTASLVPCDAQAAGSSAFKQITVNVVPSTSGDVDFGQESGNPVPSVPVGQTMQIPVFLYSSLFLQSYMVELELPGSGVEALDCSPGALPNSQCALLVSSSETGGALFRSVGAFAQSQLTGRLLVAVIKLRVLLNALGSLNVHLLQAVIGDLRVSPSSASFVIRLGTSPFVPSSVPINVLEAVPSLAPSVQQMVWGDTDGDGVFTSMDVLFMEKYMALSMFKGEQAICVEAALCQLSTRLTVWQLLQLKPVRHPAMPASKPDGSDVIFLLRALVGKAFFLASLDVSSQPGRLSVAVALRDYAQHLNPPNAVVQIQIATTANTDLAFDTPYHFNAVDSTITVVCTSRPALSNAYVATSLVASTIVDETSVGVILHTHSLDSWGSDDSFMAEDRGFAFLPSGPVFSFNLRGSLTVLQETPVFDYLPTINCVTLCEDASLFLDNTQGIPLWLNDSALLVHYAAASPPRFTGGFWPGLTPERDLTAARPFVVVDVSQQGGQGVRVGQLFNMSFQMQPGADTVALYRVLSSPYIPLLRVYGGDSPDGSAFFFMNAARAPLAQLEFRMSSEGAHVVSVALVDSYPDSSQSVIQTFWGLAPAITGLEITPLCVDGVILWSALVPSAHDEPCDVIVTPVWGPDGRGVSHTFTCTTYPCVLQGFGQIFRVEVSTFTPSNPRLLVQRAVLSLGYTTQWRATCNLANATMLDITVTERALAAGLIKVSPANALVITASSIRSARQGWATVSFGGLVKTGFNVTSAATPPMLLKGFVFSSLVLSSRVDQTLVAVFGAGTLLAGDRGYLLLQAVYSGGYTLLLDPTPGTDGISVTNASSDIVVSQVDGSFRVRRGALGGANHPIVAVGYQGVNTVIYGTIAPMVPTSVVICCSPRLASLSSALSGHPKYPSSFTLKEPLVYFAGSRGTTPLAVKFTDPSLRVTYDLQVMQYDEATRTWTLDQLAPARGTSDILVRYTHPVSLVFVETLLTVYLVDADRLDITPTEIVSHRIHCSLTVFETFQLSVWLHLTGLGQSSLDVTDEIVMQSSNPAVASVLTNAGIAGAGVGSADVTVAIRGFTGTVVVQVLDESVLLQSVSAPSNYDLNGVEGSKSPVILNGSIGSGRKLTDLSFLALSVTIADPLFPSELEANAFIVIRGNTMAPTTLLVTVPACGSAPPLTTPSLLETHVLARVFESTPYADVEIRFDKTRDSFRLTMVAGPTVFAFYIQLQTDALTITGCTLLDGMPLFSDCNTDVPALGAIVVAGARSTPFPDERVPLVDAFGSVPSSVWGFIEIYTGDTVVRYSIRAGLHGVRWGGDNASVGRLMGAALPVVDTSVLSKGYRQLFAVIRDIPIRNTFLDLLVLVSRQRLVDTRIYSNEFELSAMFHVTDRFLVPDANETRLRVLFHTDQLQGFPGGVQTPGEGFWVEAQYAFDGWYVVEFRQKIPVLRLAISFFVSTATSRAPWVWQVEGLIDTGLPLPPCPRSATHTATFLATYHITLPAFNNLSVLSRELLDRVACDVHVPSRRVMATPADSSGTITLTVALESLGRVHQTNLALMGGDFIDELTRQIGVEGDNATLVAIERGDVQYINDTRDASTICPEGVYFMGNGTYQQLPPHAIAGADCYDMVCMDQYTLIVETQRCVPTPVSMDVLWICVVVVLTVIISLSALVCCVQLAHWKTTALADVVFDPSQPPVPPTAAPSDTPRRASGSGGDDPFQDAYNTRMLYYPEFVTDVKYDAHSVMMLDAMFSPMYTPKKSPPSLFYG